MLVVVVVIIVTGLLRMNSEWLVLVKAGLNQIICVNLMITSQIMFNDGDIVLSSHALHSISQDKQYPILPTCHPVLYNIYLLTLLRGPTNHTHVPSQLFSGVVMGVRCGVGHDVWRRGRMTWYRYTDDSVTTMHDDVMSLSTISIVCRVR